jgi:hypothetical protein
LGSAFALQLDRLELLLEQIKAVEAERDALLNAEQTKVSAPPPMLLGVRGVGPGSALTLWFEDRIERNGGRRRKTTIVALARKLLVALWKYVSAGVVIEGAMIRPA